MKKLIFSILLLFTISTNAQKNDKICGSVEKYKQTHAWRDLPGCVSDYREEGEESQTTTGLLAYAKKQFKNFYDRWEPGNFFDPEDPLATYVTACNFYKDPSAKDKWESDPKLQAAEPLFEAHAKKVEELYDMFYTKWQGTIIELSKICMGSINAEPDIKKRFEEIDKKTAPIIHQLIDAPSMWSLNLQSARSLFQKAKEDKIPDDFVLGVEENNKQITIAEMRDHLLKKWEDLSIAVDKKEKEWYEEGIAPFMKLMSGERAQMFKRWFGIIIIRGSGGKKLETPQELASARVWYSSGTAQCTVCPRWSLESVHFNGNSIVKKEREEGQGTYPPTSAYK